MKSLVCVYPIKFECYPCRLHYITLHNRLTWLLVPPPHRCLSPPHQVAAILARPLVEEHFPMSQEEIQPPSSIEGFQPPFSPSPLHEFPPAEPTVKVD